MKRLMTSYSRQRYAAYKHFYSLQTFALKAP